MTLRSRSLLAAALGMALMGASAPSMPIYEQRPETNYFPGSRRSKKPTTKKHRGDTRTTNRPKNKSARQSRKRNKK